MEFMQRRNFYTAALTLSLSIYIYIYIVSHPTPIVPPFTHDGCVTCI